MRNRVLFVLVVLVAMVMVAPVATAQKLSSEREFIQYMGYVLYPDELLHDYPAYKAGEECKPETLGLTKVVSDRSWSVANMDRKTGRLFLDVIKRGESYWAQPNDNVKEPIYLETAPEFCCNRVFAFNTGTSGHQQILEQLAAMQIAFDEHSSQTGRIETGVEDLRDRIPVDLCTMFGQCQESGILASLFDWIQWGGLLLLAAVLLGCCWAFMRVRGRNKPKGDPNKPSADDESEGDEESESETEKSTEKPNSPPETEGSKPKTGNGLDEALKAKASRDRRDNGEGKA